VRDARQGGEVPCRTLHEGHEADHRQGSRRRNLDDPEGASPAPSTNFLSELSLMTLDIRQPEFWKLDKVDAELRRVYDICAGCRRCLPLCPSFKVLFDHVDVPAVDGDVEKLPAADVKEVVDLCYQCKLCYNHCPYTPPHRWQVDFPRLMLRARSAT